MKRHAPEEREADAPLFDALGEPTFSLRDPKASSVAHFMAAEAVCTSNRTTFRDRAAKLFLSRPNEWIPWHEFAAIAGRCAWRTRISDCRRDLGMKIENRVRRLESGVRVSEYRAVI